MDVITNMILEGITEMNDMALFTVICRIMVLSLSLETFGVICGHLASVGRK